MTAISDEQLINSVRGGDTRAFKEFVKRYESRVASTVIGMLGNCPEADDVGQETFIRFYKALGSFRGDSSVATYLTRIAINLSLNELKRRKRKFTLFSQSDTEQYKDIPDINSARFTVEDKYYVHQALEKLKPAYKSVVVLRLLDGYSTEETARILKIPVGTVLSRLARAQQKLKDLLAPYIGEKV